MVFGEARWRIAIAAERDGRLSVSSRSQVESDQEEANRIAREEEL